MDSQARENYLQTQVHTATAQKLHLMLIEGAIRYANQVIHHWQQENDQQSIEAMQRCRRIISEILGGIKKEDNDLTKQVSGLYLYLFRTLTEAQLEKSNEKVQDVIRVLDIERETWQKVCEDLGSVKDSSSMQTKTQSGNSSFDTSSATDARSPKLKASNIAPTLDYSSKPISTETPSGGISFEA